MISLDEGANRAVRFDITEGNLNGWFSIDENSGEITANRVFDHESDPSPITFTVRVMDMGEPYSLSNTIQVTVTIMDINHHLLDNKDLGLQVYAATASVCDVYCLSHLLLVSGGA